MVQAGCIAVAEFRGFSYGAIIYGGDDVSQDEWSNRSWRSRYGIRYDLAMLCEELSLSKTIQCIHKTVLYFLF